MKKTNILFFPYKGSRPEPKYRIASRLYLLVTNLSKKILLIRTKIGSIITRILASIGITKPSLYKLLNFLYKLSTFIFIILGAGIIVWLTQFQFNDFFSTINFILNNFKINFYNIIDWFFIKLDLIKLTNNNIPNNELINEDLSEDIDIFEFTKYTSKFKYRLVLLYWWGINFTCCMWFIYLLFW